MTEYEIEEGTKSFMYIVRALVWTWEQIIFDGYEYSPEFMRALTKVTNDVHKGKIKWPPFKSWQRNLCTAKALRHVAEFHSYYTNREEYLFQKDTDPSSQSAT